MNHDNHQTPEELKNLQNHIDDAFDRFRSEGVRGRIEVAGDRFVIMHSSELGFLRKQLVEMLGVRRARGILTRMGYAAGVQDFHMANKVREHVTGNDLFFFGPSLTGLFGYAYAVPLHTNIDVKAGKYYVDYIWQDSYEVEEHLKIFGASSESVCWTLVGYAAGYTSELLGKFLLHKEVTCRGRGDKECRVIGMPVEEWDDPGEDLELYRPDPVANQLLELQKQVSGLRYSLMDREVEPGEMIGTSRGFKKAMELLEKAAEGDVSVLLLGETGVGKELFARALHNLSSRKKESFIPVNCAALPDNLVEAELFGVEKGAYTGAERSREGRFERADGGTLFLDEIGEIPMETQSKLLRALQEEEVERLGSTETRKVDVRLIAATNVDLEKAVAAGRFRADLYYRLNVYPIDIPPLRERKEDVPELALRFATVYASKHGKILAGITKEAIAKLQTYHWPGNIRELENVIERGVILTPQQESITCDQIVLPQSSPQKNTRGTASAPPHITVDDVVAGIEQNEFSLENIRAAMIERALVRSGGNATEAARSLNMTRSQINYYLKTKADKSV